MATPFDIETLQLTIYSAVYDRLRSHLDQRVLTEPVWLAAEDVAKAIAAIGDPALNQPLTDKAPCEGDPVSDPGSRAGSPVADRIGYWCSVCGDGDHDGAGHDKIEAERYIAQIEQRERVIEALRADYEAMKESDRAHYAEVLRLREAASVIARYADHFDVHERNDPSRPLLFKDNHHPCPQTCPTIGELRTLRAAIEEIKKCDAS